MAETRRLRRGGCLGRTTCTGSHLLLVIFQCHPSLFSVLFFVMVRSCCQLNA